VVWGLLSGVSFRGLRSPDTAVLGETGVLIASSHKNRLLSSANFAKTRWVSNLELREQWVEWYPSAVSARFRAQCSRPAKAHEAQSAVAHIGEDALSSIVARHGCRRAYGSATVTGPKREFGLCGCITTSLGDISAPVPGQQAGFRHSVCSFATENWLFTSRLFQLSTY